MAAEHPMRNLPALLLILTSLAAAQQDRPNILFAISDDQSAMHAGAYGDTAKQDSRVRQGREGGRSVSVTPSRPRRPVRPRAARS